MKSALIALLFAAVCPASVSADDFSDDSAAEAAYCNHEGSASCNGRLVGAACTAANRGRGECRRAPQTAGGFCFCGKPAEERPRPKDPCDRRPLPRQCM